jgi:predicted amidohydrolase YtcJ
MLLTNGRIYTLDAANAVVDTLVVHGGRIVFAGRRTDANVPAGEPTLDLEGRAVLPGLVDCHAHLMHLARARLTIAVGGLRSEAACAQRVAEAAAVAGPDEWLSGRGWDQNLWPGAAFPTRASLDRAAPRHPVALTRIDGHATWVNSPALRAASITRVTPDPPGGRVVKGPDGEPTGLLIDTAQELVRAVEPRPSAARFDRAVREAIAHCLSVGLTGLHEMGADLPALAAYRRLLERDAFPIRNYVAVRGASEESWAHYRERGPERLGGGRVVVGALKLVLDGALGSRGALLHAPYCDDAGNAGLALLPADALEARIGEAAARGFQVCVHAIGDRANTVVLDAFERLVADRPALRSRRFRVEHAQILAEGDIPRFARLGAIPSMQPTHCTSDMPWAEARLGPDRLRGAYAWRSLLDTGVVIAGGSDFPVEDPNPFHGIHAAVTRRARLDPQPAWGPDQRMTRAEAVRAFTTWAAYAAGQEADLGALTVGRCADLVVCSDDPFTCAEEAIPAIVPRAVMVGGEVVFSQLE